MSSTPPFHIGQKVTAIRDTGILIKGKVYVIQEIFRGCIHDPWIVCVGIRVPPDRKILGVCSTKEHTIFNSDGLMRHNSLWFRGITPAMEAVTFSTITEQHPVSVN